MEKIKIIFKTKGGFNEGMGDIVSSLTIADELRARGNEVFFLINGNSKVSELVSKNKFDFAITPAINEIADFLVGHTFDMAVLNQLNTPQEEASLFKNHCRKLLTIEDTGESARIADLRFNVLYPIDNAFTDFEFIPLAPVFQLKHDKPKVIKEKVKNILVMQGGSDTYGFIPKIVDALKRIPSNIQINVVLGPNFSYHAHMETVIADSSRSFKIIRGVADLSELIMEADIAVSAAGNTLFELACLGVPTVVVCAEPFEVQTANRLQDNGFGLNLGFGKDVKEKDILLGLNKLILDYSLRKNMSLIGKGLIDGHGTRRMVDEAIALFGGKK